MSIFDLLFIAAFFGVLGALIFVAVLACRGHWTQAATRLKWLGAFVATYFAVVVVVSVVSPQRVFAVGHEVLMTGASRSLMFTHHSARTLPLTLLLSVFRVEPVELLSGNADGLPTFWTIAVAGSMHRLLPTPSHSMSCSNPDSR